RPFTDARAFSSTATVLFSFSPLIVSVFALASTATTSTATSWVLTAGAFSAGFVATVLVVVCGAAAGALVSPANADAATNTSERTRADFFISVSISFGSGRPGAHAPRRPLEQGGCHDARRANLAMKEELAVGALR